MHNFIFGIDNWRKAFLQSSQDEKDSVWIFLGTNNGQELYINDYKKWLDVADYVKKNALTLKHVGLRYRSNSILEDLEDYDGVYLVRSVKGKLGSASKGCYTIGKIKGNNVEKTMWMVPELIEECNFTDPIEKCFEEAIVYHGKQKK